MQEDQGRQGCRSANIKAGRTRRHHRWTSFGKSPSKTFQEPQEPVRVNKAYKEFHVIARSGITAREADRYNSGKAEVVEEQSYQRVTVAHIQTAYSNKRTKGKVQSKERRGANGQEGLHLVAKYQESMQVNKKDIEDRHGG